MFLNLWSKSRSEDVVQDKIHVKPPASPYVPVNHATPSVQNTKRKRDDGSPVSSQLEAPPFKRRTETMSHVQIPSNDLQRVASSFNFAQATAPVPLTPVEYFPGSNGNQQTIFVNGRAEQPEPSTEASMPMMDKGDHSIRRDNHQTAGLRAGTDLPALRETVEAQFNLEILLKHRELRLIDQEIAKCQVGLEQLRRCTILPYPALSSNLSNMQTVSDGSGPVYHNSAPHAPPWGVTNGPYTQHYAHWLLQDPAFDDTVSEEQTPISAHQAVGDRTTRGARQERQSLSGKSRASRGNNTRLTALPDGYPVAKEEKGPCIVTRSSDKKRVKLVCIDPECRRSDFNSAQGFINHCRIQHSRAFASHDAAINQCGEEIDDDADAGNNERSAPQGTASVGLVHPYVRLAFSPAGLPPPVLSAPAQTPKKKKASTTPTEPTTSLGEASSSTTNRIVKMRKQSRNAPENIDGKEGPKQPLKPSSETPYLSKLIARLGKGGDLDDLVKQATTKTEIDPDHSSDEEELGDAEPEVNESAAMVKSHSTHGGMRPSAPPLVNTSGAHQHVHGMDGAIETPKTTERPNRQGRYPSSYGMRLEHSVSQTDASMLDVSTPFNLSPNSTDPHPAPSLVSDDGDGDYENMHSDFESPSDVGDERDAQHEPRVMDHDGLDLGEGSGLSIGHTKQHHHHEHHGPPSEIVAATRRPRVTSASASVDRTNDGKHAGFQAPSKKLSKGSKVKKAQ